MRKAISCRKHLSYKCRPTQRAPEPRQRTPGLAWWESAGFLAVRLAQAGFQQSGVVSPRMSAGMVPNPAHRTPAGAYPLQGATQTRAVRH